MVCYAVPLSVAVLSIAYKRKFGLHTKYAQWFTLLFSGGAVFGVVDHLWNGELFLIGKNIVGDLLLGLTITATLFVVWGVSVYIDRTRAPVTTKT